MRDQFCTRSTCPRSIWWFGLPPLDSRRARRGCGFTVALVALAGLAIGPTATPAESGKEGPAEAEKLGAVDTFIGPVPSDVPAPYRMHRLVRHFDFEEAERAPYEMPLHFYRYGAEDGAAAGFPPFGTMELSDRRAATGRWSFEFRLDGGSMAARVPTAVIPVMPYADYVVTARLRTAGLVHARAGVSAWLHDKQGQVIEETRAQSRMIRSEDGWTTLAIEVRGDHANASDLALELQLFQPHQLGRVDRGDERPVKEDVHGTAWFDDVTIWHVPRIELTTTTPGNVAIGSDPLQLRMMVRDLAHADLEAHLRVFDLKGRVIWEQRIDQPQAINPRTVKLPTEHYGWYRALLDIRTEGELTARRWLDFLTLPPRHRPLHGWHNQFAVELAPDWWKQAEMIVGLIERLDVGTVIMPVLDQTMVQGGMRSRYEAMQPTIESLRDHDARLIFSLHSVPDELARRHDLTVEEVLPALADDEQMWRAYLDQILINYGLEVERWQIGASGNQHAFEQPDLATLVREVQQTIARFVPNPTVYVPFGVQQPGFATAGLQAGTIHVPSEFSPPAILEAAEPWFEGSLERILALQPPPENHYAPREVTIDHVHRLLHGWRLAPDLLATQAPWARPHGSDGRTMPTPAFGIVRQLIDHLHRRSFDGEVTLGQNIVCWLLRGDEPGDDALVAWLRDASPSATRTFTMQLSDGHLAVFDMYGNRHTAYLKSDGHEITLSSSPVFIEGVSLNLVRFRDSFALEPSFLPAEHRAHEHELTLRNPWPVPISGTLRLREHEDVRIAPRQHDFIIRPGETGRMPVQIIFDRGVFAGSRQLEADVRLNADSEYDLAVATEFEIGLEDLEFTSTWRTALNVETGEKDLIITHYVTNRSGRVLNADLFVIAPEFSQLRRIVSGLEPGEMAIRSFRLPNGAAILPGQSLRIGVAERGGIARLNQLLEVPRDVAELTARAGEPAQE